MIKRTFSLLCAASVALVAPSTAHAQRGGRTRPPTEAQITAYLANKPAELQPQFRNVMVEGDHNAVLNLMRSGLAAMDLGDDAAAVEAFDEALRRIEVVYADNADAARARSNFVREATKDFKGEPYERAMAYYYRGVLYLRDGDYENARASFRGGQLQDSFAEDTTYAQDFAFLDVLSGWASQCLGEQSQAQDFYDHARTLRPTEPIPTPDDHFLLLVDLGQGPYKMSDGRYMENLRFRQNTDFPERSVLFSSPEINADVVASVRAATRDLQSAQTDAELAGAVANARELRASAAEAEASLAELMARSEQAGVSASPADAAVTQTVSSEVPAAAPAAPADAAAATSVAPAASGAKFALSAKDAEDQASGAAAQTSTTEPASAPASSATPADAAATPSTAPTAPNANPPDPSASADVAVAPEPPPLGPLALAAQAARATAMSARAEATAASATAAEISTRVAAKRAVVDTTTALANLIGADLNAPEPVAVPASEAVPSAAPDGAVSATPETAVAAASAGTPSTIAAATLAAPASETAPTDGGGVPLFPPGVGSAAADTTTVVAEAAPPVHRLEPLHGQRGENLYWQASTRGGREVDGILAGKATFKANATALANSTGDVGMSFVQTANTVMQAQQNLIAQGYSVNTGGSQAMAGIGLGLMAFSLASRAVAAATTPQADIRYWDNLPAELHVGFAPAMSQFTATFLDESGARLRTVPMRVSMDQRGRCGLGWVRSQSAAQIPADAPNTVDPRRH